MRALLVATLALAASACTWQVQPTPPRASRVLMCELSTGTHIPATRRDARCTRTTQDGVEKVKDQLGRGS